jgi:hypothetical protein
MPKINLSKNVIQSPAEPWFLQGVSFEFGGRDGFVIA